MSKKSFAKEEEEDQTINDYANCENHSYEKKQFSEQAHKCEYVPKYMMQYRKMNVALANG